MATQGEGEDGKIAEAIKDIMVVYQSTADPLFKYNRIMGWYMHRLKPLLDQFQLDFSWDDPDKGYQADLDAFVAALPPLSANLGAVAKSRAAYNAQQTTTS